MRESEYTPRDLAEQTLDATLPYEETWRENAVNVLKLVAEIERLNGERFDVSNVKVRDLGRAVINGLLIMRDDEDDEDGWELPDLRTINYAMSAAHALVQQAEDRHRYKRALQRISKEWRDETATPNDIREYVRAVLSGRSAWTPLADTAERSSEAASTAPAKDFE